MPFHNASLFMPRTPPPPAPGGLGSQGGGRPVGGQGLPWANQLLSQGMPNAAPMMGGGAPGQGLPPGQMQSPFAGAAPPQGMPMPAQATPPISQPMPAQQAMLNANPMARFMRGNGAGTTEMLAPIGPGNSGLPPQWQPMGMPQQAQPMGAPQMPQQAQQPMQMPWQQQLMPQQMMAGMARRRGPYG